MKAYILIHVRPGAVPEILRNMRRLDHVSPRAYDIWPL